MTLVKRRVKDIVKSDVETLSAELDPMLLVSGFLIIEDVVIDLKTPTALQT